MVEMMSKTVKLENGHTITFDEDKHVYIHNNEYVVGMSTLLNKLASPALEAWKVNTQVNAIKKEMEKQGIPLDKIDRIIIDAKANARKQNDNILSIGSIVHKLVELWLKGEKVTKPEDKIVANCFMQFQKFWKKNKLKVIESEKILYSERGYCGTLDLIAGDKENNLWLIDIKTSKGLFLNMVHQIHGYKLAYEEQTGKKINRMCIVRLPKDGSKIEVRRVLSKKQHMLAFMGLLSALKSVELFEKQTIKYNEEKGK